MASPEGTASPSKADAPRWARRLTARPGVVVAALGLVTAGLIAQLPRLGFDTSFESFLPEGHPALVTFERFREHFGRSHPVVLAVSVPDRISDPAFLEALIALHDAIEQGVPHVSHITSLASVRAIEASDDTLRVGELLEALPTGEPEQRELEARLETNPLYRNLVVSADGSWTFIVIDLEDEALEGGEAAWEPGFLDGAPAPPEAAPARRLTTEDDAEIVAAVRAVASQNAPPGSQIRVGGGAVIASMVGDSVQRDFTRLLALAAGVIAVLLQLALRRPSAVALVLGVVGLSLGSTLGAMALLGVPVGFGTQILPTFLLAVGVGYAVHVLAIFDQAYPRCADRREAVCRALAHTGRPIALTALTTMAGLASFAPAPLSPISQIGAFAPLGVGLAAVYSLGLLPALLVLLPLAPRAHRAAPGAPRALVRVGMGAARRPGRVAAGLVVALLFAGTGIARLRLSHDPVTWLPERSGLPQTVALLDREMGGANPFELLIEPTDGRDLRSPELLAGLEQLEVELLGARDEPVVAGKVVGLHSVVKEVNQALADGATSAYRIPEDGRLVAQEILLFENGGRDDLERLTSSAFDAGRYTVQVSWADAYEAVPYSRRVVRRARELLDGLASVEPTGLFTLSNATFVGVMDSMVRSYLLAITVIAGVMLTVFRDLRLGLLSLLPNLAPIALTLGLMGWTGVPINVFTLLVGSIALGLAVDDTIHLVMGFQRRLRAGAEPLEAVRATLATTGVALLFTTCALVGGFLVFTLADLSSLLHFGLMSAAAIGLALVSDLVVSPALLVWLARRRPGTG